MRWNKVLNFFAYQWIILSTQISLLNKSHFFWSYHPEMEELLALLLTHMAPSFPLGFHHWPSKTWRGSWNLETWLSGVLELRLGLPGSVWCPSWADTHNTLPDASWTSGSAPGWETWRRTSLQSPHHLQRNQQGMSWRWVRIWTGFRVGARGSQDRATQDTPLLADLDSGQFPS